MQTNPQMQKTETPQKQYKNIVFDLGGVLLYFKPKEFIETIFPDESPPPYEVLQIFKTKPCMDLMRGLLTVEQTIKQLPEEFNLQKATRFFTEIPHMITPWQDGIDILKAVKARGYNAYVLSNIDQSLHNLVKDYTFFKDIDGSIMSYEHRCAKPDAQIYHALLRTYNLNAHECLFIDDLEENIEGAEKCGIDGIVCKAPADVRRRLKEIGVL